MGIRQPGMDREHGHLHCKGGKKCQEQPHLKMRRIVPIGQFQNIECFPPGIIQDNDPHQHQDTSCQGKKDKFYGGVDPVGTTPNANEHKHGNQCQLPKEIKKENIQGNKNTDHCCFHDQKRYKKRLCFFLNCPPGHGHTKYV